MKCYLVRHGQTLWNKEHRLQGWNDEGLSDLGKKQAKKLASYFRNLKIDYIYVSDLIRAVHTAHPINAELKSRITMFKKLREMNIGVWEGLTLEEIKENYEADFSVFNPEDGETIQEFEKRVLEAFEQIKTKHIDQDILIVTHGGFIQVLLSSLAGEGFDNYEQNKVSNASVTILDINRKGKIKVVQQNGVDHL